MVWIRNATVTDFYIREELDEAKRHIAALRASRKKAGVELLRRWLGAQPLPCKLVALVTAWALVADRELRSEPHMGRRGGPLPGFGPLWFEAQIIALGYLITGQRRRVRKQLDQRNEWGENVYKSETFDDRIVERNPQAI